MVKNKKYMEVYCIRNDIRGVNFQNKEKIEKKREKLDFAKVKCTLVISHDLSTTTNYEAQCMIGYSS